MDASIIGYRSGIEGYQRDVAESPDVHVLQQVGEIEYKSESDLAGAGGAGRTALKMVYHRPWKKDEATVELLVAR